MPQPNDLSRSLVTLDQNSTIIAVIEMSQSSWLPRDDESLDFRIHDHGENQHAENRDERTRGHDKC